MTSRFIAWNELLLAEFFSAAAAGEEVWIYTARGELDSFGLHIGGAEGLIEAVRLGVPWGLGSADTWADSALHLARQRRLRIRAASYIDPGVSNPDYAGWNAPTYLPILALWVLASSEGGPGGFYATVSKLVGMPFPNAPRITDAMQQMWEDLEIWSDRECAGRFGVFRRRVLGEHRFVGIPRSQCLVSRSDVRGLNRLFWEDRLRPGQHLSGIALRQLLERANRVTFLSRGLREAMNESVYAEPLATLIRKYLASWDGQPPGPTIARAVKSARDETAGEESLGEITLALSQSDEIPNGWDVRWRIPASGSTSRCALLLDGRQVGASLERTRDFFLTDVTSETTEISAATLCSSAASPVATKIQVGDEEVQEVDSDVRQARIRKATRRLLSWNVPDPRLGEQLVERGIPLYGPVYVLCSPSDRSSTEPWLRGEGINYKDVSVAGLPHGWWMACIERAESLRAEQKRNLSDNMDATDAPLARIRFAGGRPLLRGGSRLFAAYDLPHVEVEGPPDSTLRANGLDVHEIQHRDLKANKTAVRQFSISVAQESRSIFDLEVVANHLVLAVARLRISSPEGEGRGVQRDFSLDTLGRTRLDMDGLRGTRIGVSPPKPPDAPLPSDFEIGASGLEFVSGFQPRESVACKFLDSLASLGSMGYGAARDQLVRLSDSIDPVPLLMDLRARGHLEIQTDSKGHLVRIHSVAPALYSLPAAQEGLPVFGIAGSLRLHHWDTLLGNSEFIPAFKSASHPGGLAAIRLLATSEEPVRTACAEMNFMFDRHPASALAVWSGSIESVREALLSRAGERFTAELAHLHRLHSANARFISVVDQRMSIDGETKKKLFRFDDPQAPGLALYMLGSLDEQGVSRFAHVHDSRWGVWISVLAFAEMLLRVHGRDDACPWPIHYDASYRAIWLPARLRPPAVLERLLVLCSGREPEVRRLVCTGQIDGRLILRDEQLNQPVGNGSAVYDGFLPGLWLRYEWVPPEIAGRFAELLGCRLEPLGRVVQDAVPLTVVA